MKRVCRRLTAFGLALTLFSMLCPAAVATVAPSAAIVAPWDGTYAVSQDGQAEPEAAVDLMAGEPVMMSGYTGDSYVVRSGNARWDIPAARRWQVMEIPVPGLCDRLAVTVQGTENGAPRTAAVTYSLSGAYFHSGDFLTLAVPDFGDAVITHQFTTVNPAANADSVSMDKPAALPAGATGIPFAAARDIWRLSQNNPAHSPWATEELQQSLRLNLCPSWLNRDWQLPMSRMEFCRLAVHVLTELTGKTAAELLAERNIAYRTVFDDAEDEAVNTCALLGIVQGTNAEKRLFSPHNGLTRAQAAVILRNLSVRVLNAAPDTPPHSFADITDNWSGDGIAYVQHAGLVEGTGLSADGAALFTPEGKYTREQSMAVFLRLFRSYG